jgi:hypothetical protein
MHFVAKCCCLTLKSMEICDLPMFRVLISKPLVGVRWTCWVFCFYVTIGRVPMNCVESHKFYNNVLFIESLWPLWTWWVICIGGIISWVPGNCTGSHQFYNNVLFIELSRPLWTWWLISLDRTIGRVQGNCSESHQFYNFIVTFVNLMTDQSWRNNWLSAWD